MLNPRFMPYESKPVTRMAIEIPEGANIERIAENTYRYNIDGPAIVFKAYKPPVAGDYIVHLKDEDVYHVDREVFHERNIVEARGAQ